MVAFNRMHIRHRQADEPIFGCKTLNVESVHSMTRVGKIVLSTVIRPREAQRSGGGGPRVARWRGRAADSQVSVKEVRLPAEAPSTVLRTVPLPRFAGEDAERASAVGNVRRFLLAVAVLVLGSAPALAGPNGANVVGGAANVQGQGTANVVVNQSSQNAIINWQTFNIGSGEKTTITMPNANSAELDRVTGGLGPSQIMGSLSSNGRVFLVNRDGILFGPDSQINVGSLLASTHDIADSDFMAGRYNFNISGNPTASVVNEGSITATSGGFAALVAPGVRNTGIITAKLGTIALASGNAFTLDMYGDNLITLGVSDSIAAQVIDVSTGKPLSSLVSNEGKLKADGGRVELTAVAAREVVDSVINNSGVIEANTIGRHNGMIVLGAATASSKPSGAPAQTVKVSGTLSAAGRAPGTSGGTIEVTGENIEVAGANIDASGQAGGGAVLIGGDWGGGNPTSGLVSNASAYLEPYAVPTASTVTIDAATMIDASAKQTGNGGKVIVWSDEATTFNGTILAQGGAQSGDGGVVETSSHQVLTYDGTVNLSAPNGQVGTALLDPGSVAIDANAGTGIITVGSIESGLSSGDFIVTTGTGSGDITVDSDVNLTWANSSTLTLSAFGSIDFQAGALISNTGAGNLILRADNSGTGTGTVSFASENQIDFSASTGTVSIFYNPADNPAGSVVNTTSYTSPTDYSPYVLTNGSVSNQVTAYMLVNTVYDLQNIENNLSGDYALGTDIDASGTANWNGGAGFVPIGYSSASTTNNMVPTYGSFTGTNATPAQFVGTFDGQGHSVSGLIINNTAAYNLGLFSLIGSTGTVENVGLLGGSATAGGGIQNVGQLAGWNLGTISNSYATGLVSAGDGAQNIGGLVGWNWGGTISDSYAAGTVNAGNSAGNIGGLVGLGGYYLNGGGTIIDSYATGNVTGGSDSSAIGGLIGGNNSAVISNSYATGNVTGGSGSSSIGGLAGGNNGYWGGDLITTSYATGNVTGGSGSEYVGGLIGVNLWAATLTNSYATGNVSGGSGVGGLVGWNGYTDITQLVGSTISTSYATGLVSGASYVGGLVGYNNSGTISNSYWDTQTTGMSIGLGASTGGTFQATGLTTAEFGNTSYLSGLNFGTTPGGPSCATGGACWVIVDADGTLNNSGGAAGATRPMLLSKYSTNITNPHQLQLMELDPTATYTLANNIDLGPALSNKSDVWGPNGSAGFVPIGNSTTNFTGMFNGQGNAIDGLQISLNNFIDEGVGLFGVIGTGGTVENVNLTNATLTATISSTPDNFQAYGLLFGENFGGTISNASVAGTVNVSVNLPADYQADIGGLGGWNGGTITQSDSTATVGGTALTGSSANAAIFVGGLVGETDSLTSGSTATGAVTVAGSALGGAGGLVGFDDAGTVSTSAATGAVSGGDNSIVGGLIGYLNFGTITSAYATGAVTGGANSSVGGLVGLADDGCSPSCPGSPSPSGQIIQSSYATGAVTSGANSYAGGLVGQNGGTASFSGTTYTLLGVPISQTYATGNVTVTGFPSTAGGLVGWESAGATITNSQAFGNVTSDASATDDNQIFAGGLVGQNFGTITSTTSPALTATCAQGAAFSCAAGAVSVGSLGHGGGFVGSNSGTIQYALATGNVTGAAGVAIASPSGGTTGIGGFAGQNYGQIANSFATGAAGASGTAFLQPAGFTAENGGTINNSVATGSVSAGDGSDAGGFVGHNDDGGSITNSQATGNVTVGASSAAGGFAGSSDGTNTLTDVSASGAVNAGDDSLVGGLIGGGTGTISSSHATGNVNGGAAALVGGLAGTSGGSITQSYATGAASGGDDSLVGGLIGGGTGTISSSHATGNVNGGAAALVGGLAGTSGGSITQSYATGAASGGAGSIVGGLVGVAADGIGAGSPPGSKISQSYATGSVSVGANGIAGGLVGENGGVVTLLDTTYTLLPLSISQSYATGAVTAGADATAGGLVGQNSGTISGPSWTTAPVTCGSSYTCASGNVTVGSQGRGGGLVGYNDGTITYAFATGIVTGAAGAPPGAGDESFANVTSLGGFVGENSGQISYSFATGAVGSAGTAWLGAGGFAGVNVGTIEDSFAAGAVNAGDNSVAGGFVNYNAAVNSCTSNCGDGDNNKAAITNSQAYGDVTVGASSVAGGFAASGGDPDSTVGGSFDNVSASDAVTAGHDSIVGGLVGALLFDATLSNSSAQNTSVASTGANSIVGGVAGINEGTISNTTSTAPVSGTSDSYIGGITGINLGVVTDSATDPNVGGSGGNDIIGGIAGLNGGSIDNTSAQVTLTGGAPDYSGGVAGVNASYSNTTTTIADSSFPNGTITNSSATGSGFDGSIGTSSPAWLPALPSWLSGCTSAACTLLTGGSVQLGTGGGGGDNGSSTPGGSTIGNYPDQQVGLLVQPATYTDTTTPPPILIVSTNTGGTDITGSIGGNGGNGGNGGDNGSGPASLANGLHGGNGAPPGTRLIDMPSVPLPPGSGLPPLFETRFVTDEVVLQFAADVTPQQVAAIAQRFGLTIVAEQTIGVFGRTVYTFRISDGQSVRDVIALIQAAGLHAAAQPNYTYALNQPASTGSDSGSAGSGAEALQYIVGKFHLGEAQKISKGDHVVVAVIDSEIDHSQPELKGSIVDSYDAGCGAAAPQAHGTGMAGAIAAHAELMGVSPEAKIMAICAFGGAGTPESTSAKIIKGIDYAIAHGARIINMSFTGPRDPALAQELQIAREKGVLVIAAAGNAGPSSPPLYPAADLNVMAVTATDQFDHLFKGANQGKYVAVAAPGVDILVPAPNHSVELTTGTSVATANVSGAAALLMAREPAITPEEVRAILAATAKHLGAAGINPQFGAGLVDPFKALQEEPAMVKQKAAEARPGPRAAQASR